MKIITVLGARPQFIKAATVSRVIRQFNIEKDNQKIEEIIVHTGQHFDLNMSKVFFEQLDIPTPDVNLNVAGLSHGAMTGRMLEKIELVLQKEKPDWVLVYGDTNSTLAGALAAVKLHIPVVHVEAGLRSHNPMMPEESNRILTDRVSTVLFCPTKVAVENLSAEGFPFPANGCNQQVIKQVGDVMYDAVLHYRELVQKKVSLNKWKLQKEKYALCTLHRQENTDDSKRLENILSALQVISRDCPVVLPLHPRTRNLLEKLNKQNWLDDLFILDPVPYLDMQCLEMNAKVILTDSGGIQKEAFFHGIPCITLRDETEWVETVEMGWNQIVGANSKKIIEKYINLQKPTKSFGAPYGSGDAANQIIGILNN